MMKKIMLIDELFLIIAFFHQILNNGINNKAIIILVLLTTMITLHIRENKKQAKKIENLIEQENFIDIQQQVDRLHQHKTIKWKQEMLF